MLKVFNKDNPIGNYLLAGRLIHLSVMSKISDYVGLIISFKQREYFLHLIKWYVTNLN